MLEEDFTKKNLSGRVLRKSMECMHELFHSFQIHTIVYLFYHHKYLPNIIWNLKFSLECQYKKMIPTKFPVLEWGKLHLVIYSARSFFSSLNFCYAQKCIPFFADLSTVFFLPCPERFKVHIKTQGFCNLCWCKPSKNSQALVSSSTKLENTILASMEAVYLKQW